MSAYITGDTIRTLRERKRCTQRELAEHLGVTDKAVSKWETGKGLPDLSLVEPLAQTLGVSVAELLSGEYVRNVNRAANMLKSRFYVCPVCGNVILAAGEGAFSCCGIMLPPLEAEKPDQDHDMHVERVENDLFVTLDHPMTKQHYISFIAYITVDRVNLYKLYPEQPAEARFPIAGSGMLYAYCNRHGLLETKAQITN